MTSPTPISSQTVRRPSLFGRLIRFTFWLIFTAVVGGLGLLTLSGFAGQFHWAFDALSNFRLYYFAALLPLALFILWRRKFWLFWPTSVFLLLNFVFIAPYYIALPQTAVVEAAPSENHLRLLMANVLYSNRRPADLVAYIEETDPDIVVLVEMTSSLKRAMSPLYEKYPYVLDGSYQENIILSRVPLTSGWYDYGANGRPDAVGQFEWHGRAFTVIGTHPTTPLSHGRMAQRNQHLAHLATLTSTQANQLPVILTGDLNTTPFSVHFQTLLRDGTLRDGRYGFGLQNTWPGFYRFIRIPLDHFLHSDDIQIHNFQTGPFGGSDHRPIVVDFALPASE
ncbi:MAG: endonuclease/exonuclease/phosphatase family protein [Anaerolineales bacterium]|nr:endonuclease/exonuclease/phosphatase family protein [Anaerolineales bacterium]